MSSLTRAVTSRLNEFAHGRQRLTAEKGDRVPPTIGNFNYYTPPEIIWEDFQNQKKDVEEPLKVVVVPEMKIETMVMDKKPSQNIFTQKVTAVVRKLSPFSDDSSTLKEKETTQVANNDDTTKKTSTGRFQGTKQRMEKFKKSRQTKDKQQLIDSSDDEC